VLGAILFSLQLRGARLFVLAYSVINLYFSLAMCLLAEMAVTGEWL
jgi:hypothetical protein